MVIYRAVIIFTFPMIVHSNEYCYTRICLSDKHNENKDCLFAENVLDQIKGSSLVCIEHANEYFGFAV